MNQLKQVPLIGLTILFVLSLLGGFYLLGKTTIDIPDLNISLQYPFRWSKSLQGELTRLYIDQDGNDQTPFYIDIYPANCESNVEHDVSELERCSIEEVVRHEIVKDEIEASTSEFIVHSQESFTHPSCEAVLQQYEINRLIWDDKVIVVGLDCPHQKLSLIHI